MKKLFLILIAFGFVAALGMVFYPASEAFAKKPREPKGETALFKCNKRGTKCKCRKLQDNFFSHQDIHVRKAKKLQQFTDVHIYIVENRTWSGDGTESLGPDQSSDGVEMVKTDRRGKIRCVKIHDASIAQLTACSLWDVVIDGNRDGVYQPDTDAVLNEGVEEEASIKIKGCQP